MVEDRGAGLVPGGEAAPGQEFGLKGGEERFGYRVVVRVASASHRHLDASRLAAGPERSRGVLTRFPVRYSSRLAEAGISPSVGSVGDSYDNALAESVIGLYKTELIHKRAPWKDRDQVEYATLKYVDWFNHRRLLEPIGDIPPAEREAN